MLKERKTTEEKKQCPFSNQPPYITHCNAMDDILHIKNLPNFNSALGQRDSELLLSYLTVPYLRIPLLLTMFSTQDRIHSLRSKSLRDVLDSALFEPGRYLPLSMDGKVPEMVPSENPRLLATPYGLLVNELHRSPEPLLQSIVTLLKQAIDLVSTNPPRMS